MQFGVCGSIDHAAIHKAAGWDYIEESVQGLLQGLTPENEWHGEERAAASALPIYAANMLVPGTLKITGPEAELDKLRAYMTTVTARAGRLEIARLIFGSGVARNIPEGWDRDRARQQIIDFTKMSAELAGRHGVTIVIEPLNRTECNVINSVAEAMEYVRAVNHPNLQCLVDSYHFWLEDEPLENLRAATPWIQHVHVADKEGRVAPGLSGKSDYRPFFGVLKRGNYAGGISIECLGFEPATMGRGVLAFLKRQWNEA